MEGRVTILLLPCRPFLPHTGKQSGMLVHVEYKIYHMLSYKLLIGRHFSKHAG